MPNLLEIKSYLDRGYKLLPIKPKSKFPPLVKTWNSKTDLDLEYFKAQPLNINIAMMTGEPSGVVVLDMDGKEGVENGFKFINNNNYYPLQKTPHGFQAFFKWPGFKCKNFVKKLPGLDFRGDGGYIVAPPSELTDGWYIWIRDIRDYDALPEIPPALMELIERQGREKPILSRVNSKNIPWYITALNEGVSEGSRDETTTKLAGHFFSKHLKYDEVLHILTAWNKEKNKPALPDYIIKQKVNSIFKYVLEDKVDIVTVTQALTEKGEEIESVIEPELIVKGSLNLLVGKQEAGKTYLATQLGAAIAYCNTFLGWTLNNLPTLLVQKEIPYSKFRTARLAPLEHLERNGSNFELDVVKDADLLKINKKLFKIVEDGGYGFVILDPLLLFVDSSFDRQVGAWSDLITFAKDKDIAFLLVHHHKKGAVGEEGLDQVMGPGVFTKLSSTVMEIRQIFDPESFTLNAYLRVGKSRYVSKWREELKPKYIFLNEQGLFEESPYNLTHRVLQLLKSSMPSGIKHIDMLNILQCEGSDLDMEIYRLYKEKKIGKFKNMYKSM